MNIIVCSGEKFLIVFPPPHPQIDLDLKIWCFQKTWLAVLQLKLQKETYCVFVPLFQPILLFLTSDGLDKGIF